MPRLKLSSRASLGPLGHDQRPGDQRRRLARPAGLDRQLAEIDVGAASARSPGRARGPRSCGFIASTVLQQRQQVERLAPSRAAARAGAGRPASRRPRASCVAARASMPQATRSTVPNRLTSTGMSLARAVGPDRRSRTAPPGRPRRAAGSGSRSSPARARPARSRAPAGRLCSRRAMKSRSEA